MDDDTGSSRSTDYIAGLAIVLACTLAVFVSEQGYPELLAADEMALAAAAQTEDSAPAATPASRVSPGFTPFSPGVLILLGCLFIVSAFYSSSEAAFFSIHRSRLRKLREQGSYAGTLAVKMMEQPGTLLTTILMANMIVSVLISVVLASHTFVAVRETMGFSIPLAYAATIVFCTLVLVFVGEVLPKVIGARFNGIMVRASAIPLALTVRLLGPLRRATLHLSEWVLHVTRFDDISAEPFMTDEEFKNILAESEARGVIEEDEGQMIQGILEFGDVLLREILVPRPDVIALSETATVKEAMDLYREWEYSRMPVYQDDLDHVTGILFAKDLLSSVSKGNLELPVSGVARSPRFVPETMTVHAFVKDAQRHHTHLAIVVDEFGGTEGIVTLEDAIEQVVGDIRDEHEGEEPQIDPIGEGMFRVDGSLPLAELSELIGIPIDDNSHETVAGFLMEHTNKIPETGDQFNHSGAVFTVEKVDGKRAASLVVELPELVENSEEVENA